jgi:hypothetical protein
MRQLSLVLLTGLALCLAACGGGSGGSKLSNTVYDGKDPYDAQCVVNTSHVPGSAVPLFAPREQKKMGTLLLVRSPKCQTMWGKVGGLPATANGKDTLVITAVRPRDNQHASFTVPPTDVYKGAFGNMLTYQVGCVYATAQIIRAVKNGTPLKGPVARTPGCTH